jgi:hypothetical protein
LVILTSQGELFDSPSRETVTSVEELTSFNADAKFAPTVIRPGVTEFSSQTWLPRFLDISFETVPNTHFELTIDMSRNLQSSLDDEYLDVIIVLEMPFQSKMVGHAVKGRSICIAPKYHLDPLIDTGRIAEILTKPKLRIICYGVVHYSSAYEIASLTISTCFQMQQNRANVSNVGFLTMENSANSISDIATKLTELTPPMPVILTVQKPGYMGLAKLSSELAGAGAWTFGSEFLEDKKSDQRVYPISGLSLTYVGLTPGLKSVLLEVSDDT